MIGSRDFAAARPLLTATTLTCLMLGLAPVSRAETFDCVINPSQRLRIGSPVATTLRSVAVHRGDKVTKGQIIARLESGVEEADVALNEARAANVADITSRAAKAQFAEQEAERGEALLKDNNAPRQKVEEARTQLRVAQEDLQIAMLNHKLAELDLARSQTLLEQRTIRAPIDGVVVQRLLGPGEYVHQDAAIVELAAIDPLFVEAYPSVRLYGKIAVGMTGMVRPDLPDAEARAATVSVVDRVFDAGSGTFGVRFELPNPGGVLSAGLRCHVSLDIPTGPVASDGAAAKPDQ